MSDIDRTFWPMLTLLWGCALALLPALAHAQPTADPALRNAIDDGDIVVAEFPAGAENLMPFGDFGKPNDSNSGPLNWQPVDELVWSWTTDPAEPQRGKVLRIDTDVDQKQAYAWWIKLFVHNAPLSEVPPKAPTRPPKYDTIAGLDGGFYWSGFVPVKKGGAYRVYVDAKGPAAKVFIRGYVAEEPLFFGHDNPAVLELLRKARGEPMTDAKGKPIRHRLRYLYTTWFAVGGSQQWHTYTHAKPRHPNSREVTENVRYIRIMLYPYWPPGQYWFDNIRVMEVGPDAAQAKPEAEEADLEEGKVVR